MASWFLKGLFVDRETRTTLYEVLDVDPKVTEGEIRSAYKRRAVQIHPDKVRQRGGDVTAEAVAEFQRLNEAYKVLSNKKRRKIYNQYGEAGLKLIEDPSQLTNSVEFLFKNFVTMRNRDRIKLWLFVEIFLGSLLLAPILYCTQIDGHISASWTALATPLWFYDSIFIFLLIIAVLAGKTPQPDPKENNWTDPSPLRWRIHALLCLCLIVASQLMVTIRMDEFIDILWGYDFFVWYSFEAVLWIQIFPRMFQKTPPMPSWNIEENASAEENVEYEYLESMAARNKVRADKRKAMESFVWSLYRIHQLTMLGLKLDNYRNWNWWAVFWPTYVISGLILLRIILQYIVGKRYQYLPQEDETLAMMYLGQAKFGLFVMIFVLLMVFMAIGHIVGAEYSSFIILLPVFILSGCIMCCTTCVVCLLRADAKDLNDILGMDTSSKHNVTDLEQWGDIEEPSEDRPPSSYGTYVPPDMPPSMNVDAAALPPHNPSADPIGDVPPPLKNGSDNSVDID